MKRMTNEQRIYRALGDSSIVFESEFAAARRRLMAEVRTMVRNAKADERRRIIDIYEPEIKRLKEKSK
jgi:hypothetical protein